MLKQRKTEIKWGIIFTIAGLLWMLMERLVGLHDNYIAYHATYTNFFALIAIAIYVLALREKREKDLNGSMTWKQGFISGLIIAVVVAILTPISQWVTHAIISPDYFENVSNFAVTQGEMSAEQAEVYFQLSSYIVQSMIFALVIGAITAAIVAVFMKTPQPDAD
jgi:membrane protease YdiL (CAAX protease family)